MATTLHTLENLAENEINSDCFEVFSYSENGRETEWDGKITEFAQRAAKAIRHLTDATTALQTELQERRKADSETVGYFGRFDPDDEDLIDQCSKNVKGAFPLYRHAQPAPERDQVRSEHAEWSQVTFGNVGPFGPLKHLSKEALEAAAEPGDLSEWADMQFLLWDAQRRAGFTDEQITQAMIEKLAVNKQREWPEPKDGEPRLHINESSELKAQ